MLNLYMRTLKPTAIIFFICLSACADNTVVKPSFHYDESSLRAFVLSTHIISETAAKAQLDSILNAASDDSAALHQTISFLEKPLSDPNSSFRNQALSQYLLQAKIKSAYYSTYEKQAAEGKLKLLQQNNIGNPANDFTYVTPAGYKRKMYDIRSNFTLLYFNNPDCPACKEMKASLNESPIIVRMTKTGELKILAMYTDRDEKLWLDNLRTYPEKWIMGRDQDEYLYKNNMYDLKAIPTVYLLDVQKKVLLKDVISVKAIEDILSLSMKVHLR
jgi:hypothetical protein